MPKSNHTYLDVWVIEDNDELRATLVEVIDSDARDEGDAGGESVKPGFAKYLKRGMAIVSEKRLIVEKDRRQIRARVFERRFDMPARTFWISPTDWVSGDTTLRISYPSAAHPATEITATAPGDLKWVFASLRLPAGILIKAVQVCYQLSDRRSFISQVRLEEMQTPEQAVVRHDDPTDLLSTTPTCYVSQVGTYRPAGAVTLALRLKFANANQNHKITLGSVGIDVETCEIDVANVKCFGAVGDGVADDTAAIAAANAFAAANGGSVYFPPGTYRVASNSALTQHVVFAAGAILKPDSGAIITIRNTINAPSEPVFDSSVGGVFRITWEGEVYANWWTGADFSKRFNHCRDSIDLTLRSTTGPRVIKVVGRHTCTGGLNLTMIRRPLTIDFSQSQLIFAMAGGVAIDCTGSWQLNLIDPWIIGDETTTPDVGLLHARNQADRPANPPSAGRHSIWRPRVEGAWKLAAYYNIGSEANQHWGGEYTNTSQTTKHVAFLTKKNIHGVSSAFDGVTPGNGTPNETTATGQEFFGTQFRGRDIPNDEGAGIFVIYGFSNVVSYGSFFISSYAPHVLIDHTEFGIVTLELIGIFTHGGADEGETLRPAASIKTFGDIENPLRKIRVSARKISVSDAGAAFDIGPSKLLAPELTWSEKQGLRSHPDSLMSGAMIRVPANLATPLQLGNTFGGEIYCGPASTVDYSQTRSNRATIFASDGVLQFNQAKLPARDRAPSVNPGEAIVWLSNGAPASSDDGDLMVTIGDTTGTVKTIKLVDFSEV